MPSHAGVIKRIISQAVRTFILICAARRIHTYQAFQ